MNLLIVFAFAGDSTMTRFLAIAEGPECGSGPRIFLSRERGGWENGYLWWMKRFAAKRHYWDEGGFKMSEHIITPISVRRRASAPLRDEAPTMATATKQLL